MPVGKVLLFTVFQIILTQCMIPLVPIQSVNQHMVQHQRQRTMEMCRIFKTETAKLQDNHENKESGFKRSKRFLKDEEDMAANGAKVQYRNVSTTTAEPAPSPSPSRRFNFAPYYLGDGGSKEEEETFPPPHKPAAVETVHRDWFKYWKYGIVPYFIDPKTYDAALQDQITDAFDYFEKATCIRLQRLREKPTDKKSLSDIEWIYITNSAGIRQCVHSNERIPNKGVQMVVLGYECMSLGEIVHELMHILGFPHEHTRRIRDQHITIVWDNIKPGYKKYFELTDLGDEDYCTENPNDKECLLSSVPYDYSSIMHYPPRAFSRNGQVTIKAKDGVKLGQREGLSEIDVQKVALVYDGECVDRNKKYLQTTCPTVNEPAPKPVNVTDEEIKTYFQDRIWSFGKILYKFRDNIEFSVEEKENLKTVFKHIEKLTCIRFSEVSNKYVQNEETITSTEITKTKLVEDTDSPNNSDGGQVSNDKLSVDKVDGDKLDHDKLDHDKFDDDKLDHDKLDHDKFNDDKLDDDKLDDDKLDFDKLDHEKLDQDKLDHGKLDHEKFDHEKLSDDKLNDDKPDDHNPVDQNGPPDGALSEDNPVGVSTDNENTMVKSEHDAGANDPDINSLTDPEAPKKTGELQSLDDMVHQDVMSSGKQIVMVDDDDKGHDNKIESQIVVRTSNKSESLNTVDGVAATRSRKKRSASDLPTRRHADQVLVLHRSSKPGCKCDRPVLEKKYGAIVLELSVDCLNSANDLIHVFGHVLGLDHQHNMYDRDYYIHIDNTDSEFHKEMEEKLPAAASVGFPYDYHSVMHFPWLEIKNGVRSIMYPIWNDGWAMGHWHGLSPTDAKKIDKIYREQCQLRKKLSHRRENRKLNQ